MNKYDQILERFSGIDTLRLELITPFNYEGTTNVFATDAHALVCIPANLCEKEYKTQKKPNVSAIIGKDEMNIIPPLSIDRLEQLINRIPTETISITKECEECDGIGTVVWEYKHYEKDFQCPKCGGEGDTQTGKTEQIRAKSHCIKIANNYFYADVLEKLVFAARKLECSTVYQANDSVRSKQHNYKFYGIEVVIMPIMYDSDSNKKVIIY